jgi:NAD+ diphosphatase
MKMDLDQEFMTTIDLPFNRAILDEQFQLASPEKDPGGEGYWLMFAGMKMLVIDGTEGFCLPLGELPFSVRGMTAVYIGQWQSKPCRLISLAKDFNLPPQFYQISLREDAPGMSLALLSLGGVGSVILHWEQVGQHCGNCGTPMERIPGGWGKRCPNCENQHFPRIHPCVIGLIVKGNEILLARRPGAPNGRYGLVAGFVEFSESLEEAMMRETLEETGLEITNIRYVGSQSWPFPSQLMCGFVADYAGGEIELRDRELEDAQWFHLDQLPNIAPKRSIARYLIDHAADYLTA